MTDLDKILERVNKNGIAITPSNRNLISLPKKEDVMIFRNRKRKESIVVDMKKLKELLGTDLL